tara:strand:+ start:669 stop:1088 length:420 start_codon:yes stop_codon:yes gene_type:complete
MYDLPMLGISDSLKAMQAMLEEALKEPDRPVSIAIVDNHGLTIQFARMDQCRLLPQQLAYKKAYTAAVMRSDTLAVAERFKNMGRSISEMGDSNLVGVQGGIAIQRTSDGALLGAIGVSGLAAEEDESLARLGLNAMQL